MKFGKRFAIRQRLFASVAVSALMVGTAFTADAAPPALTWTGFYVGANLGWYQTSLTVNDLDGWWEQIPSGVGGRTWSLTGSGVLGGVQTGYNWQIDHFVLGVEGDFDLGTASRSANGAVPMGFDIPNIKSSIPSLGTIRGRFGYTFDPCPLLVYGTAGLAFGQVDNSIIDPMVSGASWKSSEFRGGYAVGGGLEYAITPNWSVKAEALYIDLGTQTVQTVLSKTHYSMSFRDTAIIARGGINYKF